MSVLTTTGVQSEAHLPFAGLHQLLRPVRGRTAELPAVQRAALDAAFGITDDVAPAQYRIAMAALDLVSEVATDAPLLLVVEDAQWLDRPTLDVLAFVARRIESDPIILLAAVREGYPSVLVDAGLPEHRLAGLNDATAGALLDAWAPELPLSERTIVMRAAAGNPLALLELPAVVGGCEDTDWAPGGSEAGARFEEALARDFRRWPFQRARIQLAHGQWLRRQPRVADSRAVADLIARAAREAVMETAVG